MIDAIGPVNGVSGALLLGAVLLGVGLPWRADLRAVRTLRGRSLLAAAMPTVVFTVPAFVTTVAADLPSVTLRNDLTALVAGAPFLLVTAAFLVLRKRGGPVRWSGVVLAVLSALALVMALFGGQGWIQPLIGVFVSLVVAFSGRLDGVDGLFLLGGRFALALFVLSMLVLVLIDPAHAVGICRADKCSIEGQVLVMGDSGNGIGLFVAFLAPFALLRLRWWRLLIGLAAVLLVVDLTSGRAAFLGAGMLAVVLIAGLVPALRRSTVVAIGAVVISAAIAAVPAVLPWSQAAFTTRGSLWARAKELFVERPVFGWGPAFWTGQRTTKTFIPNYGVHNTILELLVAVGAAGLVLVVAALVVLVVSPRGREGRYEVVTMLVPIIGAGMLESTLVPYRFTILFAALPIVIIALHAANVGSADGPQRGRRARRVAATITSS